VRKIVHVDMDAFYASVEQRDQPELRGRPIAVGGRAEQRGVLATASYEARKFGVRSAMPTARALRLCPELVLVPPRFTVYREESRKIRAIFGRYTEAIEPLSLDEAYLDVSECRELQGSATRIAEAIRASIREELNLTASAGVAPNKFLAKVASDWRKPDGLTVIRPEDVEAFVHDLPVGRIPGVGPKTRARLELRGLRRCADLQALAMPELEALFGSWAPRIHGLCRGVDDRPVVTEWEPRQVSVERTFASDFDDLIDAMPKIEAMAAVLRERIAQRAVATRIRGLHVKLRLADFTTRSADRARRGEPSTDEFVELLARLHAEHPAPVRLIGLGVRLDPPRGGRNQRQLDLFDDLVPVHESDEVD
jgi:DNA polymerase-4